MYKSILFLLTLFLITLPCFSQQKSEKPPIKTNEKTNEKKDTTPSQKTPTNPSDKQTTTTKTINKQPDKKQIVITMDDLNPMQEEDAKEKLQEILKLAKEVNDYYAEKGNDTVEYAEKYYKLVKMIDDVSLDEDNYAKIVKPGIDASNILRPIPPTKESSDNYNIANKQKENQNFQQDRAYNLRNDFRPQLEHENIENPEDAAEATQNPENSGTSNTRLEAIRENKELVDELGKPVSKEREKQIMKDVISMINKRLENLNKLDPSKKGDWAVDKEAYLKDILEKATARLEKVEEELQKY